MKAAPSWSCSTVCACWRSGSPRRSVHGSKIAVIQLTVKSLPLWIGGSVAAIGHLLLGCLGRNKIPVQAHIKLLIGRLQLIASSRTTRFGNKGIDCLRADTSCTGGDCSGGHGIDSVHERARSSSDPCYSDCLNRRRSKGGS